MKVKIQKLFLIIILAVIAAIIAYLIISKTVENRRYEEKCSNAYNALFVNEKAEVVKLHEAIAQVIETPDSAHYSAALETAENTEAVCMQTFGNSSDIIGTYGSILNYYATFYRDVKFALSERLDLSELQQINDLISEIIILYNAPANPATANEKISALTAFHNSVYILLEDNKEVLLNIYE